MLAEISAGHQEIINQYQLLAPILLPMVSAVLLIIDRRIHNFTPQALTSEQGRSWPDGKMYSDTKIIPQNNSYIVNVPTGANSVILSEEINNTRYEFFMSVNDYRHDPKKNRVGNAYVACRKYHRVLTEPNESVDLEPGIKARYVR